MLPPHSVFFLPLVFPARKYESAAIRRFKRVSFMAAEFISAFFIFRVNRPCRSYIHRDGLAILASEKRKKYVSRRRQGDSRDKVEAAVEAYRRGRSRERIIRADGIVLAVIQIRLSSLACLVVSRETRKPSWNALSFARRKLEDRSLCHTRRRVFSKG